MAIFVDLSDHSSDDGDARLHSNPLPQHSRNISHSSDNHHRHTPAGGDSLNQHCSLVRLLNYIPLLISLCYQLDETTAETLSQTCHDIRDQMLSTPRLSRAFRKCQDRALGKRTDCPGDWVQECVRCSKSVCRNCNRDSTRKRSIGHRTRLVCLPCQKAMINTSFNGPSSYEQSCRDILDIHHFSAHRLVERERFTLAQRHILVLHRHKQFPPQSVKSSIEWKTAITKSLSKSMGSEHMVPSYYAVGLELDLPHGHDININSVSPNNFNPRQHVQQTSLELGPKLYFCQCRYDPLPVCGDCSSQMARQDDTYLAEQYDCQVNSRTSPPSDPRVLDTTLIQACGIGDVVLGSGSAGGDLGVVQRKEKIIGTGIHPFCYRMESCVDRRWMWFDPRLISSSIATDPSEKVRTQDKSCPSTVWSIQNPSWDVSSNSYRGTWIPAPLDSWHPQHRQSCSTTKSSCTTFKRRRRKELTDPLSVQFRKREEAVPEPSERLAEAMARMYGSVDGQVDEPTFRSDTEEGSEFVDVQSAEMCGWCGGMVIVVTDHVKDSILTPDGPQEKDRYPGNNESDRSISSHEDEGVDYEDEVNSVGGVSGWRDDEMDEEEEYSDDAHWRSSGD